MARLVLLAALAVVAAGCSDSLPGGKVVTPTPVTVVGTVIKQPWTGGKPAAGLALFTSSGCSACHTFAAAHATGTVGPNLDKLPSYYAAVHGQGSLAEYVYNFIVAPHAVPGYKAGIMPATFGQTLKPAQLADLVAFLTKGS